jgi:hypothetical protein
MADCNYCDLQQIRRDHRREKDVKISTYSKYDWVGVYRHPKLVNLDGMSPEEREPYWIRSYATLTTECVC